jgi:hypothetical protein
MRPLAMAQNYHTNLNEIATSFLQTAEFGGFASNATVIRRGWT